MAGALIYFFLMLPILVVFPISLSSAPYLQFPPPGLSWQWYERYLDDPQWIDATWRSLYIGGATAVLALLLGVPLAFSLVRGRFFGRVLVDRLALAPIIVPTIILSVAVYGVFASSADRRLVRPGGGAHRSGAAVRGPGDDGGPADFDPRSSRRPRAWEPVAGGR